MNAVAARSVARSLAGLVGVALALAALVIFVPGGEGEPGTEPFEPSGATMVQTLPLDGDRSLRLWVSPSGYWVQSLRGGQHVGAVGAMGDSRTRYSAHVFEDGLVGVAPPPGARTVTIRAESGGDDVVRATVHDRMYLAPAWIATPVGRVVLVRAYDDAGRPLGDEVTVPIDGR